ncbi:hypothetical protein M8C21_009961 [Ambrosia artemisiifolia]|uniref:Uncharacterized protein n=1 Tax=Ambrosia artemisiifolia TaxID=4212 RepID=A0AAD5BTU5_AMBAR|nr:hypothetical protein M8C21_009961 [Ambrosia artemisiifolia]
MVATEGDNRKPPSSAIERSWGKWIFISIRSAKFELLAYQSEALVNHKDEEFVVIVDMECRKRMTRGNYERRSSFNNRHWFLLNPITSYIYTSGECIVANLWKEGEFSLPLQQQHLSILTKSITTSFRDQDSNKLSSSVEFSHAKDVLKESQGDQTTITDLLQEKTEQTALRYVLHLPNLKCSYLHSYLYTSIM